MTIARLAALNLFLLSVAATAGDGTVQEFVALDAHASLPPMISSEDAQLEAAFAVEIRSGDDETAPVATAAVDVRSEISDEAFLHFQAINDLREISFDTTARTRRLGNVAFIEREEGNVFLGQSPERDRCRVERVLRSNHEVRNNPYASAVAFRLYAGDDREVSSRIDFGGRRPTVEFSLDEEDYDFRVTAYTKQAPPPGDTKEVWKIHAQDKHGSREVYMELEVERGQAVSVFLTHFEGQEAAVIKSCSIAQ